MLSLLPVRCANSTVPTQSITQQNRTTRPRAPQLVNSPFLILLRLTWRFKRAAYDDFAEEKVVQGGLRGRGRKALFVRIAPLKILPRHPQPKRPVMLRVIRPNVEPVRNRLPIQNR